MTGRVVQASLRILPRQGLAVLFEEACRGKGIRSEDMAKLVLGAAHADSIRDHVAVGVWLVAENTGLEVAGLSEGG